MTTWTEVWKVKVKDVAHTAVIACFTSLKHNTYIGINTTIYGGSDLPFKTLNYCWPTVAIVFVYRSNTIKTFTMSQKCIPNKWHSSELFTQRILKISWFPKRYYAVHWTLTKQTNLLLAFQCQYLASRFIEKKWQIITETKCDSAPGCLYDHSQLNWLTLCMWSLSQKFLFEQSENCGAIRRQQSLTLRPQQTSQKSLLCHGPFSSRPQALPQGL